MRSAEVDAAGPLFEVGGNEVALNATDFCGLLLLSSRFFLYAATREDVGRVFIRIREGGCARKIGRSNYVSGVGKTLVGRSAVFT